MGDIPIFICIKSTFGFYFKILTWGPLEEIYLIVMPFPFTFDTNFICLFQDDTMWKFNR